MSIWEMKTTPMPEAEYEAEQKAREAVFNKIVPKGNWKDPICAWIKGEEFEECSKAAVWFTGAPLTVAKKNHRTGQILVKAPGYYATIGA